MKNIRKKILFLAKVCISGLIAVAILSAFCLIYYNPPIAAPQKDRYTNYAFTANRRWSFMTEGWGFGKTNNLGYIDSEDSAPAAPDIIVMGSSHTEALQVSSSKNYVALTEAMLLEDADPENNYSCLNIGISGHTFGTQISNLPYLLRHFDGMKYVVIETSTFDYTPAEFQDMLDGKFHSDLAEKNALYSLAQKIPYLRLLSKQYNSLQKAENTTAEQNTAFDRDAYETAFASVAAFLAETAKTQNFEIVLLYHANDLVESPNAAAQLSVVKDVCSAYGICLVDTALMLSEHYEKTHQHPYGFSNTTPGTGHLNETGHGLIAQALYEHICEMEGAK